MNWFIHFLIVAMLSTTGILPSPWAHTHQGMQGSELSRHLKQFHPLAVDGSSPLGWHWHFVSRPAIRSTAFSTRVGKEVSKASDGERLRGIWRLPRPTVLPPISRRWWRDGNSLAMFQQKTYLRLLVLRN